MSNITFALAPELIISICAISVSIIGLWITARYNRKTFEYTKDHNKKMTQPHLTVSIDAVPKSPIKMTLRNCGFGPAKVSSIKYMYNKEISYNFFNLLSKINSKFENSIDGKTITFITLSQETIIAANDELELMYFAFLKGFNMEEFYLFVNNLKIEIKFKNIYDEECIMIDTFEEGHKYNLTTFLK